MDAPDNKVRLPALSTHRPPRPHPERNESTLPVGGSGIKKFVRTARRYRTIHIRAGAHTLTAADPLPDDLGDALKQIHRRSSAHQLIRVGSAVCRAGGACR